MRGTLLVALVLAAAAAAFLATRGSRLSLFAVTATVWFAVTHTRLAIGRWPAVTTACGMAALLAGLGAGWGPALVAAAGGLLGAELTRSATGRLAVLEAGAWTGAAGAVAGAALAVLQGHHPASLPPLAAAAELFAAGVASSAAILALGAPLEWLFGHVTRLTLAEWLNYDHPLIRELSALAPGTLQHAANVSLLADEAARAIGADALLARVGGLYHDVGKTGAPEYFIENQHGRNPHDDLPPARSAAILRAHVTDGVALIRAHQMGERLADFVREHHGTSTMRGFQEKARAAGALAGDPDETYRYPGPPPRSRETGIVMMADQLEASARAAPPRDEPACTALVDETLARIDAEGQLAGAGFRRRDLPLVHDAFVRVLSAMYHRRLTAPYQRPQPRRRRGLIARIVPKRG